MKSACLNCGSIWEVQAYGEFICPKCGHSFTRKDPTAIDNSCKQKFIPQQKNNSTSPHRPKDNAASFLCRIIGHFFIFGVFLNLYFAYVSAKVGKTEGLEYFSMGLVIQYFAYILGCLVVAAIFYALAKCAKK